MDPDEILAGVVLRPNDDQEKKSSSSSSSASSKVAGTKRNNGKQTSSTLLQSSVKDQSVTSRNNDSSSNGGGGMEFLPAAAGAHEVKEVAVSRVSCHRCGNIRKNKLHCTRNMCPYIFCGKCVERMREEHGQNVFDDGCPVCKELCCCASKTINCDRINHCYRKCPASKHSHKQGHGRHSSGGVINGGAKHPMPSWNYVGIPHQFIPNPAMYYGSQYPFPPQAIMPNNFMGGFLPPNAEETSSSSSSDGTKELNGNIAGNMIGSESATSSSSSMAELTHGPSMNQHAYLYSLDQEQDIIPPVSSVAAEITAPLLESSSIASSVGPESKKARLDSRGEVPQGYPAVSHGFPPQLCMGMVSDYYLDDSRVPVPAPGREQFQLPMSMPFQLPNFGGASSNSFGAVPSTMSNPGQQFPFPMQMNLDNMEPHQVAAFTKVMERAMMNQANQLHSFSQFYQAHQLHSRQQQERYQQRQQQEQQQHPLQQQVNHLKMIDKPSASPSQQILHRLPPQHPTQRIFEPSQFSGVAAEEFFSGEHGMIKPDIVGADELLSNVETGVHGTNV